MQKILEVNWKVKYDVATIEKAGTPEFANQVKSIRNYSSFAKGFMPTKLSM